MFFIIICVTIFLALKFIKSDARLDTSIPTRGGRYKLLLWGEMDYGEWIISRGLVMTSERSISEWSQRWIKQKRKKWEAKTMDPQISLASFFSFLRWKSDARTHYLLRKFQQQLPFRVNLKFCACVRPFHVSWKAMQMRFRSGSGGTSGSSRCYEEEKKGVGH